MYDDGKCICLDDTEIYDYETKMCKPLCKEY